MAGVCAALVGSTSVVASALPAYAQSAASLAQADRSVEVSDWAPEPVAETPVEEFVTPAVVWPAGGVGVVDLPAAGVGVRSVGESVVGGLPVRVAPVGPWGGDGVLDPDLFDTVWEIPERVRVEVLDRDAAGADGVGVVLRVSRADGRSEPARVRLSVDFSGFRHGFGADWGNRLRLAEVPDCATGELSQEEEAAADCEVRWLSTSLDFAAGVAEAQVTIAGDAEAVAGGAVGVSGLQAPVGSSVLAGDDGAGVASGDGGTLLMLLADASGEGGDFTKTDLKASYSWVHGGASGHFGWSYPIGVPPVPGGLVPSVSLDYNSGAVDGQTAGQNTQPTIVGEGWNYAHSYVERTYRSCHDDTTGSPHWTSLNTKSVLCWRLPNAQIVLNGKASEIVLGGDGVWRLAEDDGEKVELLTGASNRDNNGEHWKVTTTDGTQYWFGRHFLPSGRGETFSTAEVRVYANHSGEPCFSTVSIAETRCNQAYRWMLDYVVDRHGNEMALFYSSGTNRARDTGSGSYQYRRTIRLARIEYGLKVGDSASMPAPARVMLSTDDRCLADCYLSGGGEKVENWPDTPFDLHCTASPCANNESPSFWGKTRLSQIRTQVRDGGSWRTMDQWDLTHTFPSNANNMSPMLWLSSIQRTAYGADGTPQVFPTVSFTGERRSQRADYDPGASMADPRKWRIVRVNTETGGRIEVVYNGPQDGCVFGSSFPTPHSNTRRCFPRLYTNSFQQTGWAWWHLFTVNQIVEKDLVGGSPDVVHAYTYGSSESSTSVKWAHDNGSAVWGSSLQYRSWSDWRGWPRVTVRSGTASEGPRSRVDTVYFRGLDGDRADSDGATRTVTVTDIHGSTWNDFPYKAGKVMQQVTYDVSGGSPQHVTRLQYERHLTGTRSLSSTWAVPATHRSYIGRTQFQEQWDFDPVASDWTRFERVRWRWDSGNGRLNSVSDTPRQVCTRYEYADNTSKRLLSFIKRETVNVNTCDTAPGQLLADTRHFYDNLSTHGATPTTGNLTRSQVWNGTAWFNTSQAGYDTFGRAVTTTDGLGRQTSIDHTHNSARLLIGLAVTNPAGHETSTTIEPGRGLPLTVTDPNGRTTTGAYDPAGRLLKVWAPGHPTSGTPTAEYTYSLTKTATPRVSTRILGPNGNQILSTEIYDGLLRLRQTQTTAPDGKRVITDTTYNHRGLPAKTSSFYNSASGPTTSLVTFSDSAIDRQIRYTYDGRGRQTQAQRWSQGSMLHTHTTTYGYRDVLSIPPAGGTVTRQIFNGNGLKAADREYHTTNPTGGFDETSYSYDQFDRLIEMADPGANTWTYTYDLAGRQVQTSDPDTGTTTSVFDNAGQTTSITDARGVTLAYAYDQLGRTTAIHQGSLSGTMLAQWEYDTLEIGLLSSATRHHDGLAYTSAITGYDHGYRPLGSAVTIPASAANGQLAGTYEDEKTYHVDGSLATHVLPAAGGQPAETLTYSYTNQGLLASTTGLDNYLAAITYRWDGAIAETLHGTSGKQIRRSYAYQEATGRLLTSQVDTEDLTNPSVFLDRFTTTSSYDPAGNTLSVAGYTAGTLDRVECYNYDPQRRLVEAWTHNTTTCGTPGAAGADPYHRSWTFDQVGNRITQTDHNPTVGNTTWTYHVGTSNGVTPHQVAEVTATGPQAGTPSRTFTYDQAGNTTSHTTDTGATQTLTWTPQGQLDTLTDGTDISSYIYDADGNRLLAHNPDSATLYLGNIEIEEQSGGALVGTRYYDNIAVRTPTGLVWVCTDRNGTSLIQIDADTHQAEQRRYLPYGEPHTTPAAWAGTHGYIGGTTDPTGLTHLGARYYDPTLGRFTSVDPILALGHTQQMNGYTYANNNPILYHDPTGLIACAPDAHNLCPGQTIPTKPKATSTSKTSSGCQDTFCRPGFSAASSAGSLANLSPAPGTPKYNKAKQDAKSLPPELVGYAVAYASHIGVPQGLLIALLMQEQPIYANSWWWVKKYTKRTIQTLGALGLGHGGDASVGRAQMKPFTASRILGSAGYATYSDGSLRGMLTHDDEFAVFMAALHLKLDLESGMNEKQAYLSYALDPETAKNLLDPSETLVQNSLVLSERSARYDANMSVLQGELWSDVPQVVPRYGVAGGICPTGGYCSVTGQLSTLFVGSVQPWG